MCLRFIPEKIQSCARLYGDKDSDWTNDSSDTILRRTKDAATTRGYRSEYRKKTTRPNCFGHLLYMKFLISRKKWNNGTIVEVNKIKAYRLKRWIRLNFFNISLICSYSILQSDIKSPTVRSCSRNMELD